jgi:hypothetical protein
MGLYALLKENVIIEIFLYFHIGEFNTLLVYAVNW